MSKHKHHEESPLLAEYQQTLHELQVELVKLQSHVIRHDFRILVVLEGRDAAGKDGAIKRIIKHLSPRETRVVALGKPSNRDESTWYFQRYVPHLPAGGEMVLFNRSWYNRAGVERVMGFCMSAEYKSFLEDAPHSSSSSWCAPGLCSANTTWTSAKPSRSVASRTAAAIRSKQ